jgi:MFS family permease
MQAAMPDSPTGAVDGRHGSAFAFPLFRRYFFVACLSTAATWITRVLLGWSAWELSHSALWVGIASALMLLPTFVLSPLFGVLSDRVSPRNGMLVTLSAQGLLAGMGAAAYAGGWFDLGWLLALALAVGAVSAAHQPLRLALIPRLVGRDALPAAIGISAILFNLSRILGPAAGGWLITVASNSLAFAAAAALFAGAVAGMLLLRGIEPARLAEAGTLGEQLIAGVRFAREQPAIRLTLLLTLVNGLLGRSVIELLPAVSGQLLDGTPASLATLTAAAGAGSVLGGLMLTRLRSHEPAMVKMVLASLLLASLTLLPLPWARSLLALAAIVLLLSLATTMAGTGSQALAQLAVDEAYRGRVLSLWTVFAMGAPALGGFTIGALSDALGMVQVLVGAALLALMASVCLWFPARALARPDAR